MYRLPLIIGLISWVMCLNAQSPHGENLTLDCVACHTTEGWEIQDTFWETEVVEVDLEEGEVPRFNHSNTDFPLEGIHEQVSCNLCHASLVFDEADADCEDQCHGNVHPHSDGEVIIIVYV